MNVFGFNYIDSSSALIYAALMFSVMGIIFALFRFIVFTYFERKE